MRCIGGEVAAHEDLPAAVEMRRGQRAACVDYPRRINPRAIGQRHSARIERGDGRVALNCALRQFAVQRGGKIGRGNRAVGRGKLAGMAGKDHFIACVPDGLRHGGKQVVPRAGQIAGKHAPAVIPAGCGARFNQPQRHVGMAFRHSQRNQAARQAAPGNHHIARVACHGLRLSLLADRRNHGQMAVCGEAADYSAASPSESPPSCSAGRGPGRAAVRSPLIR